MMQLLAAIPTIISAVGKVSDLFKKGQNTVEEITGNKSVASTPEELQTEVINMTPDQQNRWAAIMSKQVDMYVAANERLAVDIGLIDQNITSKVDSDAASEIAKMRMTTRPWAVRCMVYYVLFPFFLVVIDIIQNLILAWLPFLKRWVTPYNTFEHVFGWPQTLDAGVVEKLVTLFKDTSGPATFAGKLYIDSIPWVVSIIVGYMTMREVGKWRGSADKMPGGTALSSKPSTISVVSKTLTEGAGLVSKIKTWFK